MLLNAGAVVEPRVRVLWASYGRPSLLVELLLTSLLSVACTITAGALFRARRDLVDARGRSLTALVESEASRVKHVGVVRPAPAA